MQLVCVHIVFLCELYEYAETYIDIKGLIYEQHCHFNEVIMLFLLNGEDGTELEPFSQLFH